MASNPLEKEMATHSSILALNTLTCVFMLTNTFVQSSTHMFTKAKIYSQWTALTDDRLKYTLTLSHLCSRAKMLKQKNPNNKYGKKNAQNIYLPKTLTH